MIKMIQKFISSDTKKRAIVWILALLFLSSCTPNCSKIEPEISYVPPVRLIQSLPSPFAKLTKEELRQEWGKQLFIGLNFANDLDLYRAITAFKTALIFIPASLKERRLQIEYCIFASYYFGQKYPEAIETFSYGGLSSVMMDFPAYKELLIMLYDCYQHTGQTEHFDKIFQTLEEYYPETAASLALSTALQQGDIDLAGALATSTPNKNDILGYLDRYESTAKSVKKAKTLNALLPGAGYYYVGQKKAALTSFIINALFIGATYCFVRNHNIPAGIATASLEAGWYIGGINGAGLAAKEYNQRLYEVNTKELLLQQRLFPILLLEKTF
jgi:hypothetical protein